jgi:ketosteroid isomerase-like protein
MEINTFLDHKEEDTPNVMLVKDLYKAMASGDKATTRRVLTDNPTWSVCPGNPEGGTFHGKNEINAFYRKLLGLFHHFKAEPEVFIDGGDVVVVLGFYSFVVREGGPIRRVRLSHTWRITSDHRIDGVWQVCDSYEMRRLMETE